jgi:hypothetical protein
MVLRNLVYAALAVVMITSCSSRDTKATYASSSPNCKQSEADADHVLTKVGRTVFWLEIKLLEQNKKTSSRCSVPR